MSARFTPASPRRRLLQIVFAFALAIPGVASACALRMGALVASPIAYDPFGQGTGEGSIRTTIDLVSGDDCAATLSLIDEAAAPLRVVRFGDPARGVVYRIEVQPGDGVQPGASPDIVMLHLTATHAHLNVVWRLIVAQDAVLAAGDYGHVVLAEFAEPDAAPDRSARTTLMLRSIARAQANFAGTTSGFAGGSAAQTIDLGNIVTGEERTAMLQVRANTTAHLAVSSQNRGYLVGVGNVQAKIRYGLAIDGATIDLGAPATRTIAPPLTIDGVSLELRVSVGTVEGMPAGRYSDTITIDISP